MPREGDPSACFIPTAGRCSWLHGAFSSSLPLLKNQRYAKVLRPKWSQRVHGKRETAFRVTLPRIEEICERLAVMYASKMNVSGAFMHCSNTHQNTAQPVSPIQKHPPTRRSPLCVGLPAQRTIGSPVACARAIQHTCTFDPAVAGGTPSAVPVLRRTRTNMHNRTASEHY